MTNHVHFVGDVSGKMLWRSAGALLAALFLWMVAVGQLLLSVPRSISVAQNFGLRLPWYMEAVKGMPVWAVVVAAGLVGLLGLRCRGWLRLMLLVGVPVVLVLAIHLSIYGTQTELLWGLSH